MSEQFSQDQVPDQVPDPLPNPFSEIRVLSLQSLRGINYWSRLPVTRMDVNIGAYEDISSAHVPWFTNQLVAALPGLLQHYCSVGRRGGFVERLERGTYAAHIIEHVALELQTEIGHDTGFGRTRGSGELAEYTIVFEHEHQLVGLRAAALAL
ncbi:MAG: cyanophycin synthetase family protein, partial [Gemmatimonadaceae bacterium]